jgi:hypothetical protein
MKEVTKKLEEIERREEALAEEWEISEMHRKQIEGK